MGTISRVTTKLQQNLCYYSRTGYVNPKPVVTDYESFRRSRVWSTTTNFKSLKRAQLPSRSYTDSITETDHRPATCVLTSTSPSNKNIYTTTGVCYGVNTPSPSLGESIVAGCYDSAVANAASKMGNYTVNVGVSMAEGKKTIAMFTQAASQIVTAAISIKHGRFKAAAKVFGINTPRGVSLSQSFANNWLLYRYGWRTLMFDVDGAVKHLAQVMSDQPPMARVQSRVRDVARRTFYRTRAGTAFSSPNPGLIIDSDQTVVEETMAEVSVTYKFEMTNTVLSNVNQLGLLNPLAVGYELIPLSFVLDWFVNVGDVLNNLTSFSGKTFKDGCVCKVIERSCRTYVTCARSGTDLTTGPMNHYSGFSKRRVFARVPLSDFLYVTPRINVSLGGGRIADAISLISQTFSSRR